VTIETGISSFSLLGFNLGDSILGGFDFSFEFEKFLFGFK